MTAIALRGIGKDYGATTAVRSVDLTIESGELFFLLGPSGCGKTTLLRMIAGFIEPTRGRIQFGPRDVTHVAPNARNAGMVFQSYALWPHMTVYENVAFGLQVRRRPRDEQRRRALEALELVRMAEFAQRKPNQLSGGQQQRVALARALAIEPTVLLLDEPLSNLDAKLRTEMRTEIRRLVTSLRVTTVYVTHDQKEALSMADRMAVLRSGEIVQEGAPVSLYRQPKSRFVAEFLGETNVLDGRVKARDNGGLVVSTDAGDLRSAVAACAAAVGDAVLISMRPEALRMRAHGPGPQPEQSGDCRQYNVIRGRCRSSMYLGDAAQHHVQVSESIALKVHESNPFHRELGEIVLDVDARDVVVLPDVSATAADVS